MLQILEKPVSTNDPFAKAAKDYFKGKFLPGVFTYSSPKFPGDVVNGAALFTRWITTAASYYPKRNEEALIPKAAPIALSLCGYFNLLADIGCGNAFAKKVVHFIGEADYGPLDQNQDYLDESSAQCHKIFPYKKIHPKCADFLNDKIDFPGVPMPIMLGCTITNFGTPDSVRHIFRQIKPVMEQGNGSFIFTHDTNTDPVSLTQTYTHELIAEATLNVLHRMKRDIPTENFNPEDFAFHGYWEPATSCFNLSMYPKKDMYFKIDDEWFDLKKDQILIQAPLMKLSSEHALALAQAEGLNHYDPIFDHDRRIALQQVHL